MGAHVPLPQGPRWMPLTTGREEKCSRGWGWHEGPFPKPPPPCPPYREGRFGAGGALPGVSGGGGGGG